MRWLGYGDPRRPIRTRWRGLDGSGSVDVARECETWLNMLILRLGGIVSGIVVQILGHLLQAGVRDSTGFLVF